MSHRISAFVFRCHSREAIPNSQRLEIHPQGHARTANHFSVGISATARKEGGITRGMMRVLGSYALLLVSLGLGAGVAGDVCAMGAPEPLWAYGYSTPPLPSDKP